MSRVNFKPAEIHRLARDFNAAFGSFDTLRYALHVVGQNLDVVVKPNLRLNEAILSVLIEAQNRNWLRRLLRSIIASRASYGDDLAGACKAAITLLARRRLTMRPYSPTNPMAALLMENGEPFVDRDALRPKFSDFVHASARSRVFVVRGPTAVGKSHLWYFFNHLAEPARTDFRAYVDIATMAPGPVGARQLMTRMADRMRLDTSLLSTDRFAQHPRIAEKMCDWFIGQAQAFQQDGHRWWIAIDALDKPFVTGGAIELTLKLATAVARQEVQSCFLLLLGLNEPLPLVIKNMVEDENLESLSSADVSAYISRLAMSLGKRIEPDALQVVTSKTLSGLALPYGHAEMDVIKHRLKQLPSLFQRL